MTITGTVIQILPVESGTSKAGKAWQKGAFVVETLGQYPKKIHITLFGKALENVKVQQGVTYDIEVEVSSRDYQNPTTGKVSWFTEVSAFRATPSTQSGAPQPPVQQPQSSTPTLDAMGVKGYQPTNQTPPPNPEDLPF